MVTKMQLKVLFGRTIAWPPGLLEREREKKVVPFLTLFLMFTRTWITEAELEGERVIENKGDEFRRKKNMKIS